MPFTLFHIGPNSFLGLLLSRRIDIAVFVLAGLIPDIEGLAVILFGLGYSLHGYMHTLLFGSLLGVVFAVIAYSWKDLLRRVMEFLRLPYETDFSKMLYSAVIGVWLHILLDAPIYADIRPFYPMRLNPFYGLIGSTELYAISAISFVLAAVLYLKSRR